MNRKDCLFETDCKRSLCTKVSRGSFIGELLLQVFFTVDWGWKKLDFCIGKMMKVGGD